MPSIADYSSAARTKVAHSKPNKNTNKQKPSKSRPYTDSWPFQNVQTPRLKRKKPVQDKINSIQSTLNNYNQSNNTKTKTNKKTTK